MKRRLAVLASLLIFCAAQTKLFSQANKFGEVNEQAWQFLASSDRAAGTQMTLLAFGLDPALLDETPAMKCYISMFNRTPQAYAWMHRNLNNELAYPDMVAFYKPRIPKILTIVPRTIQLGTNSGQISVAGRAPFTSNIQLGEYDTTSNAFPFADSAGRPASITFDSMGVFDSANCDMSAGLEIVILLEKPITFTQLPMEQEAAKAYLSTVGRAGQARQIRLGFALQILDEKPKISAHPTNPNLRQVFLKARVNQIVALAMRPNVQNSQIGVVYPTNKVPK